MSRRCDWQGVYVVTVTPFTEAGAVDHEAFGRLLQTFVGDGVDGVVVAGSTGKWYTLHDDERLALFEQAVECVGGRLRLIAGTSAIGTDDAVSLTRRAMDIGMDGAMVLAPPYALPNRRELMGHFDALAAVGLPLMVYNNPGRTQVNLTAALLAEIARHPTVVALEESSKDLYQIAQTVRELEGELAVFSGLEPYALPTLSRGAVGIVSMAANFAGRRPPSWSARYRCMRRTRSVRRRARAQALTCPRAPWVNHPGNGRPRGRRWRELTELTRVGGDNDDA